MRNSKGSMAIALVLALVCIVSIISLTNLMLAEKVANRKYDNKTERQTYQTSNSMEMIINVMQQKLVNQNIPFKQGTFYVMNETDLEEVEFTLNEKVFPFLEEGTTVNLSNLEHSMSLDMLCEETIGFSTYTSEPEVVGTDCEQTFFDISFDVELTNQAITQNFTVTFKDVYSKESPSGNIELGMNNLNVKISNY